jgi:hypothetical protein
MTGKRSIHHALCAWMSVAVAMAFFFQDRGLRQPLNG